MKIPSNIKVGDTTGNIGNLMKATQIYNNTGNIGWYKIAHSPQTGGWGENCFVLLITSGTGKNKCAIILIEYYNNANYQFKKLLGNISVDDMKVIKNSDNSLDVYIRAVEWYQPLQIQLLSWYGQTNDYPIQTEWIGSSLPTGGIQYSFTDI